MSWRSFKEELLTLLLFGVLTAAFYFSGIGCPLYKITGIPCPTCGMTRAIISLLHRNFRDYAAYNVMALPVCTVFAAELFGKAFERQKKAIHIFSVVILAVNLIYYFSRIFRILQF